MLRRSLFTLKPSWVILCSEFNYCTLLRFPASALLAGKSQRSGEETERDLGADATLSPPFTLDSECTCPPPSNLAPRRPPSPESPPLPKRCSPVLSLAAAPPPPGLLLSLFAPSPSGPTSPQDLPMPFSVRPDPFSEHSGGKELTGASRSQVLRRRSRLTRTPARSTLESEPTATARASLTSSPPFAPYVPFPLCPPPPCPLRRRPFSS